MTVTLNVFGWGFACVSSRAIRAESIQSTSMQSSAVLIPLFDLMNHDFQPNVKIVDKGDYFELRAIKNISRGAELRMNYGPLTNLQFLSDYGITFPNNPNDEIPVIISRELINYANTIFFQHDRRRFVSINGSDPKITAIAPVEIDLPNWKKFWLRAMDIQLSKESRMKLRLPITSGSSLSDETLFAGIDTKLLGLLRVLVSTKEDELLQLNYTPMDIHRPRHLLSLQNEAKVLQMLISIVLLVYAAHNSAIEDDLISLQRQEPPKETESTVCFDFDTFATNPQVTAEEFQQIRARVWSAWQNIMQWHQIEGDDTKLHRNQKIDELISTIGSQQLIDMKVEKRKEKKLRREKNNNWIDVKVLDEVIAKVSKESQEYYFQYHASGSADTEKNQTIPLSLNKQELYKFRIHKKLMLINIIRSLASHYSVSSNL